MSTDLLNILIVLSEKAANIARICRQDKHLLSLLVQEKTGDEKNPRFIHDFKTFADVLIQEVVKHHVVNSFPFLKGNILGEETNTFKRGDECITVEVKDSELETEDLLFTALQDKVAAQLLSKEVHKNIISEIQVNDGYSLPDNIAIWIDPIDSTAEYIHGKEVENSDEISADGVQCVTVLIGAFCKDSGQPILGVINQPFYTIKDGKWCGRCFYGICSGNYRLIEPTVDLDLTSKVIVLSSSERDDVKNCFVNGGYTVVEAAGAGYKGLAVVTGNAKAYILSKGSTYPWDVCAVHAILCAAGGGIVDFQLRQPLTYSAEPNPNSGGLIAYRDCSTLEEITSLLDTLL